MDPATERALTAIERAVVDVRQLEERSPISLSSEYLEAIHTVERFAQNQSGADKTWMERARETFLAHFARARRR
ncbi:MAG: hypothetical protein HYX76_08090 [Acidobacteria bacterium]|nr:hypothetical protein [Acidobacteriota bacterium]